MRRPQDACSPHGRLLPASLAACPYIPMRPSLVNSKTVKICQENVRSPGNQVPRQQQTSRVVISSARLRNRHRAARVESPPPVLLSVPAKPARPACCTPTTANTAQNTLLERASAAGAEAIAHHVVHPQVLHPTRPSRATVQSPLQGHKPDTRGRRVLVMSLALEAWRQ